MRPQLILSRLRAVVQSAGLLAMAVVLLPANAWPQQSAPDCAATCTACAPCGTLCTDNSGTSPALSACALQPSPTCSWLQPCSTVCTSAALCSTKCVDTSVPACTQSSPETTCGQMPGSQDICQQPSGQLLEEMSFYHQDHLGSVRMITDAQGAVVSRHDYLPFGEEIPAGQFGRTSAAGYGAPDLAPQRFTGKERDFENGLDYFGARYYSGAMGRFTNPDPLLNAGHPGEPQTWNRYAYALSNPLRFIDPTGLYVWGKCSGTEEECAAYKRRFRDALAAVKEAASGLETGSKERKTLEKVIRRIGEEGAGKVSVNFGDAGHDENGRDYLGEGLGNRMTLNFKAVDSLKSDWQRLSNALSPSEAAALDAGLVAHEGGHLGSGPFLLALLTMHRDEHGAYYVESVTYQGLHNTDRPSRLWNESWLRADRPVIEQKRESAIQDILLATKGGTKSDKRR